MRIRHILPEFGRVPRDVLQDSMSGNVRAAVTIATRQSRVGDDCVELLGLNRDRPNRSSRLEGVRIWATRGLRIGEMGSMDWRYLLPLYARALESSADVLHVHDNPFLLTAPRAARRILHIHTPVSARANAAFIRSIERADWAICNSSYIRSDFLSCVPFPEDRTSVIHNAVDPRMVQGGDARLRSELGIADSSKALLFVGQLSWQKGLIHLIQALRRVHGDVDLIVVGGSDLWQTINDPTSRSHTRMSKYETAAHEAAAGLPVHFLGTVPTAELKHVYASGDIFVSPSQ